MSEEKEEMITFSEAARLKGVTPQTIDDYVKRDRLSPIIKPEGKFLKKNDVLSLKKGKSGRPPKSKKYPTLEELVALLNEDNKNPPYITKFFFPNRKYLFSREPLEEIQLWTNPIWRRNKRKLRYALKEHQMLWYKTFVSNQKVMLTVKYQIKLIQDFYEYCIASPKMYDEYFSVVYLKQRFISLGEQLLDLDYKNRKFQRERELVLGMFDENLSIFESDYNPVNKPYTHTYNIVDLLLHDSALFVRLKGNETNITKRILKVLYDAGRISTKEIKQVKERMEEEKNVKE